MNDDLRIAWARIDWTLDTSGDGPEYRQAWADLERLIREDQNRATS